MAFLQTRSPSVGPDLEALHRFRLANRIMIHLKGIDTMSGVNHTAIFVGRDGQVRHFPEAIAIDPSLPHRLMIAYALHHARGEILSHMARVNDPRSTEWQRRESRSLLIGMDSALRAAMSVEAYRELLEGPVPQAHDNDNFTR